MPIRRPRSRNGGRSSRRRTSERNEASLHRHFREGKAHDGCDRCDIANEIEIEFVVKGRVDCVRWTHHEQDIAVSGRAHDGLGEASGWFGVGAPSNTPVEIIDKLNKEIEAGVADPKLRAQLTDLGGIILSGSQVDFSTLITDETEKWGKVIRAANIKAD